MNAYVVARRGGLLGPWTARVHSCAPSSLGLSSDDVDNGEVRAIVVVGASAGGVQALSSVFCDLPVNTPIVIFVALHLTSNAQSHLPWILARTSRLPAERAIHNERFKSGKIYVAPPGFHTLIGKGILQLRHVPKRQHPQPGIDPMFHSVARNYGQRVVGILLSGMANDGVEGLKEIKRCGGLAIVQDPVEAEYPELPKNALAAVNVDACLPAAKIREIVTQLPSSIPYARQPRRPPECESDGPAV